jgi:hypothetical protein
VSKWRRAPSSAATSTILVSRSGPPCDLLFLRGPCSDIGGNQATIVLSTSTYNDGGGKDVRVMALFSFPH